MYNEQVFDLLTPRAERVERDRDRDRGMGGGDRGGGMGGGGGGAPAGGDAPALAAGPLKVRSRGVRWSRRGVAMTI